MTAHVLYGPYNSHPRQISTSNRKVSDSPSDALWFLAWSYHVRGPSALLSDPGNPNAREKTLAGRSAQLYRVIIQVGNPAPGGGEVLATPSPGCTGSGVPHSR